MRLRDQILSILNTNNDFLSKSIEDLGESRNNLQKALTEIISASVNVIFIQCILNDRSEEICRMAKDCSLIDTTSNKFLNSSAVTVKGNGANSELFADRFAHIVEIIAQTSQIKSSSVKKMFSILTPLVLSDIYFKFKAFGFTMRQLASFLEKEARRNKTTREIDRELALLIKNEIAETDQNKEKSTSLFTRILHSIGISGKTVANSNS